MRIHAIYILLEDGRCIFDHAITPEAPPRSLVTGMIAALQAFVKEVTGEFPTYLSAGGFSFHMQKRGPITVVVTSHQKPQLDGELESLHFRFLKKYGDKISNFAGDIRQFRDFIKDVEEILGKSVILKRANPAQPLNAFMLLEIQPDLLEIAKAMIALKEASVAEVVDKTNDTEYLTRVKLEKLVELQHLGKYERDNQILYYTS